MIEITEEMKEALRRHISELTSAYERYLNTNPMQANTSHLFLVKSRQVQNRVFEGRVTRADRIELADLVEFYKRTDAAAGVTHEEA